MLMQAEGTCAKGLFLAGPPALQREFCALNSEESNLTFSLVLLFLSWYLKAQQIAPKNGRPYNQLALLAIYTVRCWSCEDAASTGRASGRVRGFHLVEEDV